MIAVHLSVHHKLSLVKEQISILIFGSITQNGSNPNGNFQLSETFKKIEKKFFFENFEKKIFFLKILKNCFEKKNLYDKLKNEALFIVNIF